MGSSGWKGGIFWFVVKEKVREGVFGWISIFLGWWWNLVVGGGGGGEDIFDGLVLGTTLAIRSLKESMCVL